MQAPWVGAPARGPTEPPMVTPFQFPWDNRFLTLEHVERVWRKLYPVLPPWVHEATTIYAFYIVVAALLVVALVCAYKTLELSWHSVMSGSTRGQGLMAVLLWDVILAYPIWFIWT